MAEHPSPPDALKCSFCHKSQREVKRLIAGPGVNICDECVFICLDIVREDARAGTVPTEDELERVAREASEHVDRGIAELERCDFGSATLSIKMALKRLQETVDALRRRKTLDARGGARGGPAATPPHQTLSRRKSPRGSRQRPRNM